jgi:topoisomerase-4 subunit A
MEEDELLLTTDKGSVVEFRAKDYPINERTSNGSFAIDEKTDTGVYSVRKSYDVGVETE